MCSLVILEDNSKKNLVDILTSNNTPVHYKLVYENIEEIETNSINVLKSSIGNSFNIMKQNKRLDSFRYELIISYIINSLGLKKWSLDIQVFEEIEDAYILEELLGILKNKIKDKIKYSFNNEIKIWIDNKVIFNTVSLLKNFDKQPADK